MRKYFAEGVGTFLLVSLGTLAVSQTQSSIIIAVVFGLTLTLVVMIFGNVSGAHVNPAVSMGAWVRGDLSSFALLPYWIAQFTGAVCGSLYLSFIVTGPDPSLGEVVFRFMTPTQAFLLEAGMTFIFVTVVLALHQHELPTMALFTGGALLILHLMAFHLTSTGLNPARAMGPLIVSGDIKAAEQIWVYVFGPFSGGALAGLVSRETRFSKKISECLYGVCPKS
jgi:aquaporin Z